MLIAANRYPIGSVHFSPDGKRLVSGGYDGWIRIYDSRSGRPVIAFPGHRNWVEDVRFSPDGRLLASASVDQTVRVWNANDGTLVASLDLTGEGYSVSFSSDGRRLLIGAEDGVRIWDFATDRTIVKFRGFTDRIFSAEFALHDTRVITSGLDATVRLWTVPKLPSCQGAIDRAHALMAHELTPQLRKAEFITPRHSPSILNALLPSQSCS
jgi:WD40 repeat protein